MPEKQPGGCFRGSKIRVRLHVTLNNSQAGPLRPRRLTWINHGLNAAAALFLGGLGNYFGVLVLL